MKSLIRAGLGLVAGILVFAAPLNAQTALSLGTSTLGARFHILAVGMGDTVSRNSNISVTVEPIGGSDANVRALAAKRIEVAMMNSLAGTHGTASARSRRTARCRSGCSSRAGWGPRHRRPG